MAPSKIAGLRRHLGILDKSKILLYTGRLSRQKQILSLIKCFEEASVYLLKNKKAPPHLLLAGNFDDLGRPYLDEHDNLNQYFSEYALLKNSLSPEISKRILYLGNLNEGSLCSLYNLADAYISLSLHNDEDFGMSPAEALCSGTPAILTSWGGFNSFAESLTSVTAISTNLDAQGPSFNKKAAINAIIALCQEGSRPFAHRQKLAKEAQQFMSTQAVANKLKDLHNVPAPPFLGFNSFMKSLPSHLSKSGPLFYENSKFFNDEYLRLYNSYVVTK
ncbi:MAG: glycosyltransferase [Bdellovibrio sp.]|nr:glycosyltransferase [Bdellovibrio sp.]